MFKSRSLHRGGMNDIIYDAEGALKGQYRCVRGVIWVHGRDNMGSSEWAVMGLG